MPIKLDGPEPPPVGPESEVVRVTTTAVQNFVLIAKVPKAVNIHWTGTRSAECTHADGYCELCEKRSKKKYKVYIDAIRLSDNVRVFLELTQTAWNMLNNQLFDNEDCRGRYVAISKGAGGPRGKYVVLVTSTRVPGSTLPDEKDPLPILRRLWNWGLPLDRS